jgi:adenylate kinase
MTLNVVMLGPPGAGKGTQADRFARDHAVPKISTGEILRDAVHRGTELGRAAKATMDAGQLVGDGLMIGIVQERLERPDTAAGFVLDGFPRTVPQARALDELIDGRGPLIVLDIVVPWEELVRRLASRRICAKCGADAPAADGSAACAACGGPVVQRTDDGEAIVRERLRVYEQDTRPLVEFYRSRPTFRSIAGHQRPDAVASEIRSAVQSLAVAAPERSAAPRVMRHPL